MVKKSLLHIVPGLALAVMVTLASFLLCGFLNTIFAAQKNFISPILVAILLGILIKNSFPIGARFDEGIQFGIKRLLRLGIILMGIRLSIVTVLHIGAVAAILVCICIASALLATIYLSKKIGVSGRLGALIAAGTSICGVSAIVAISPAICAKEEETAYAVGTITIFGIFASITYPYISQLLLHLPVQSAGFFIGTAVHDTSQVTACSLIYDQLWKLKTATGLNCSDIAIATKLVRNTLMIVVIPILGALYCPKNQPDMPGAKIQIVKYIPLFVLGYIVMGIVRSAGDFFWGADHNLWSSVCTIIKESGTYCITLAITCTGLNTDIRKLSHLGYKPFFCGLCAALFVGVVSWVLVTLFGKALVF